MKLEKKESFIILRAKGMSFQKISDDIGVSKPTLIKWSKDLREEISNFKKIEWEFFLEEHQMLKKQRFEQMALKYRSILTEIEKRDYSSIPTGKLFELLLKFERHLEKSNEDITFTEKDPLESIGVLGKLNWDA